MVTCQFEKIIKGQNQLPWVFIGSRSFQYYYISVMAALRFLSGPGLHIDGMHDRPKQLSSMERLVDYSCSR